jgi:hypothetical protein
MATLAELRAKLKSQEESTGPSRQSSGGGDKAMYPFWNIPNDTTAVLRFLPDGDESNTFFWQERQIIRLTFPGVKGGDENRDVTVNVPCMEMFENTGSCPILSQVRPWFKDPSMEAIGRKYWKKRAYIFQGFVSADPMNEEDKPENPIRRFVINPSIFKLIKAALMDPEMEELPTDYTSGTDFRLTKTQKGQYADYSTSNWARKERTLSEPELEAIQNFGLFNLSDFLPKKPSATELEVIKDMFEASVDGQLYDVSKWGEYYRPYGIDAPATGSTATPPSQPVSQPAESQAPVTAPATPPQVEEDALPQPPSPSVDASADSGKPKAEDILAMIRQKKTTEQS